MLFFKARPENEDENLILVIHQTPEGEKKLLNVRLGHPDGAEIV